MQKSLIKRFGLAGFGILFASLLLLFQNCGPARLEGGALDNAGLSSASLIGSKVDLDALLKSPQESEANVLFPSPAAANNFDYAQATPVIENLVLLKNDFSKIEWVHGPSATVVAAGDVFNQSSFRPEMLGTYYVFGYRGDSTFLLTKFQLIEKGPTTLGVTSANAVSLNQRPVSADGTSENVLVSVEAPAVDLSSVQIVSKKDGSVLAGRRAALISKNLSETMDVEFRLADVQGQTLVQSLNLVAKTGPSPSPAPAPTPAPAPSPVQSPAPAPAPPTIVSGPGVDRITATDAVVTWSLSEPATGQVEFGTTTSYGSFSALESSFNYSTHTIQISGLSPGTTYHYRVISKNAQGAQVVSADKTFATLQQNSIMAMPNSPFVVNRGTSFTAVVTVASAVSPTNENLSGFVHIVTRSTTPASVLHNFNPSPVTTSWNGNTVTYHVPVAIPADLPLGEYTIRVGFMLSSSPNTRIKFNMGPGVKDDGIQRYVIGIIKVQ